MIGRTLVVLIFIPFRHVLLRTFANLSCWTHVSYDNDSIHRNSMRKEQRLCAISGTTAPRLPYMYTDSAGAKKAPLVWSCCKTTRRLADQGPASANTASHVAQANWRPAEDVGNHDQGRPGTPLRTVSHRSRTMEKGMG